MQKGDDPRKFGKRIAIIQSGFKNQVEEKKRFLRLRPPEALCTLARSNREHVLLKGGEIYLTKEEDVKVEPMLSLDQSRKCYNCGEIGHVANKYSHKKWF